MSVVIPLMTLPFLVPGISPSTGAATVENAQPKTEITNIIHPGEWTENVEEARQISVQKEIPLFLHFEAPWCGACVRMHKHVLNDSATREFLGKYVIGVRVNTDHHRDLVRRYRVSALPTDIVIGPDGTERSRYVGAVSLRVFLSRLKTIAKQVQGLKPVPAVTQQIEGTDSKT